jgi:hypothetical protein
MPFIAMKVGGVASWYTLIYQNGMIYAQDHQNEERYGRMKISDIPIVEEKYPDLKIQVSITDGKFEVPLKMHDSEAGSFVLPKGFDIEKGQYKFEAYNSDGDKLEIDDEIQAKIDILHQQIISEATYNGQHPKA